MARYRVAAEWRVDAPAGPVWNALLDVREWPRWWTGMRAVEVLEPGDEHGVGMVVRQHWRSMLPYTMVLDLTILDVERFRSLSGLAAGDMAGTCRWTFRERDGRTDVRFTMDVRPTHRWMNLPVPFAGAIFVANFDGIMHAGARGLARMLRVTVRDHPREVTPTTPPTLP